jgi:putative cardiolipin synthase
MRISAKGSGRRWQCGLGAGPTGETMNPAVAPVDRCVGARALLAILLVVLLGACASPLHRIERPVSHAVVASDETALGALARRVHTAQPRPQASGFRTLPQAPFALDARVELMRRAERSLDVQYYLIAQDQVGHLLLRELALAAARGVRVRLLVDDYYTLGQDADLLALAAQPRAEVRLFNPFTAGRDAALGRMLQMAGDFRRLNHRMHNKLLVADGAMAIFGGRNMADEYFQRHAEANFLDFDLLAVGPVVDELGALFDRYWNSVHVLPVQALVRSSNGGANGERPQSRATHASPAVVLPPADLYGDPPLAGDLDRGLPRLIWALADAHADTPDKVAFERRDGEFDTTVTYRTIESMRGAHSECVLVSPYFIPGVRGLGLLRAAQQKGVTVRVVTNSLAATDEPLVAAAYGRYRIPLLQAGVELVELSPAQLRADSRVRTHLGESKSGLHAKLAVIDRQTVWIGSMNLDPRSAWTNTELGVRIDSTELAERILALPSLTAGRGAYRLRIGDDGRSLQWLAVGDDAVPLAIEPESGLWQRLKVKLLSLFVAEDLL